MPYQQSVHAASLAALITIMLSVNIMHAQLVSQQGIVIIIVLINPHRQLGKF